MFVPINPRLTQYSRMPNTLGVPCLLSLLALAACGGGDDDPNAKDQSASGGETTSSGGDSTATGATGGSQGAGASGGSGSTGMATLNTGGAATSDSTSNSTQSNTATTTGSGGTGISPIPGDPGCGLESAAFCDNFDAVAPIRGRGGDVDPSKWSVARGNAQFPSSYGTALPVGPATIPSCRPGLPEKVFPVDDSLICDPSEQIQSNHLLVAVGAQNYGQNSYRIRQPFDFAGRTGKIVFDAEGYMINLLGWLSVAVTEDPAPIPSYSIGENTQNDEGGAAPRSGVLVQFIDCLGGYEVGVRMIDVFDNYQDDIDMTDYPPCVEFQQGHLNHFELHLSQDKLEVYGSPYSDDGVNFGDLELLHSTDLNLPFSRGYVQLTVHNHATIKYSQEYVGKYYDAWFSRFDNVGFDGPVVENWREYEVPPSLVEGQDSHNISGPIMNVGYIVADEGAGPLDVLEIHDVELDRVVSARLAIASWYLNQDNVASYALKYRLNGGDWLERPLTSGEAALLNGGSSQGALAQMLDVPVDQLVNGTNTLEFVSVNVPQTYPPVVSGIDLVLQTE